MSTNNKWSDREVGAFWKREGKSSGRKYLAGHMEVNGEKQKVVVFSNSNKKNDKAPDFRVYLSDEVSREGSPTTDDAQEESADLLQ
tara:strand:- start:288 stop:545 length:258 start_codon:yes stop_codon:yes gene_type:complete